MVHCGTHSAIYLLDLYSSSRKNGRGRPVQDRVPPESRRLVAYSEDLKGEQPSHSNATGLQKSYVRSSFAHMRILIAEDDRLIADGLSRSLRQGGYAVDWAANGLDAEAALQTVAYDLLILDIGLPKLTGLEVLKRLRSRNSTLPVLILTAMDGIGDRVKGLDLGADDYMVKPFELAELEARVRALTRRSAGTLPSILCGALTYDQVGRVAHIHDQALELSAREIGLLEVLLTRMGRLVSKDQLVDHLCGWGEEVSHNAIEVYVHRLRKKLESGGVKIATVRGLGYCLERPHAEH